MDIGIYSLQAARYLTGEEPTEINAMIFNSPGDVRFKEVEETINFQLRFPSGVLANGISSYGASVHSRFQATTPKGFFELQPANNYTGLRMYAGHGNTFDEVFLKPVDHFAAEMDHLSECVMENKTPLTPGEEGLRDLKIMTAIYQAAQSGGTTKL